MRISVIIPALNEATGISETLEALRPFRAAGHEVIVVDGGSSDDTVTLARPLSDRVLRTACGRAQQMNAGVQAAVGEVLVFVHADTRLPPNAVSVIADAFEDGVAWTHFDVSLTSTQWLLRVVATLMNARSRLTGIVTGDQVISVRRDVFLACGGFPDIPLMEDVELSRRLKAREGPPMHLREKVITSSRRWECRGVLRTILLMWHLRLAYFCGADPARLAARYNTVNR